MLRGKPRRRRSPTACSRLSTPGRRLSRRTSSRSRREPSRHASRTGCRSPPRSRALGFAAGVGLMALRSPSASQAIADGLVSDYARAAIAGQPFDVASSDRHTVKPWLAGRTTVSADIVDLAPQGFPLAGGRVSVVGRVPAPTLVYRHNEHLVAVTELPLGRSRGRGAAGSRPSTATMWRAGPTRTSPMSRFPIWTQRPWPTSSPPFARRGRPAARGGRGVRTRSRGGPTPIQTWRRSLLGRASRLV